MTSKERKDSDEKVCSNPNEELSWIGGITGCSGARSAENAWYLTNCHEKLPERTCNNLHCWAVWAWDWEMWNKRTSPASFAAYNITECRAASNRREVKEALPYSWVTKASSYTYCHANYIFCSRMFFGNFQKSYHLITPNGNSPSFLCQEVYFGVVCLKSLCLCAISFKKPKRVNLDLRLWHLKIPFSSPVIMYRKSGWLYVSNARRFQNNKLYSRPVKEAFPCVGIVNSNRIANLLLSSFAGGLSTMQYLSTHRAGAAECDHFWILRQ